MTAPTPSSLRWCPSCQEEAPRFLPGPGGRRPDATCPHCRSLERHRFLSVLLEGLGTWLSGASLVLDIAPSSAIGPHMRRLSPNSYVSLDFDPAADDRDVDVRASVEALPFADASVDFLTCYHVLEHVPDDRAAMSEIARVLKSGGMALVQVPWRPDRATDEDISASVEERERRFGQADHVRYYGRDFDARLQEAGLQFTPVTPREVVGEAGCDLMGLMPGETVWVVRRAAPDGRGLPREQRLRLGAIAFATRMLAEARSRQEQEAPLLDRLTQLAEGQTKLLEEQVRLSDASDASRARLTDDLARARAQSERWERAYRRLRGRAPVRAMAALSRTVRRSDGGRT